MRLRDKVAIVTGAVASVGQRTALRFAREGARLVVTDLDEILRRFGIKDDDSGRAHVTTGLDLD